MSEEENNENLLDAGISGISKSLGGKTKILVVIIIAAIAFFIYMRKRRK